VVFGFGWGEQENVTAVIKAVLNSNQADFLQPAHNPPYGFLVHVRIERQHLERRMSA
jgi:hypothetical protein